MKKLKKGNTLVIILLLFAVMSFSGVALTSQSAERAHMRRQQQQIENIYTYQAIADIVTQDLQRTIQTQQVSYPRTPMQNGTTVFDMLSDLKSAYVDSSESVICYTPEQLASIAMPTGAKAATYYTKTIDKSAYRLDAKILSLYTIPQDTIVELVDGTIIPLDPYTIQVTAGDGAFSYTANYQVRGVVMTLKVTPYNLILKPDFSGAVISSGGSRFE